MVPEKSSVTERIFCHFGQFFAHLPTKTQKIYILKKREKNPGDIIILHKCTKNHDNFLYCSWDMASDRRNCHFSFWTIFCPFTPLTARKMKISQKWKKIPGYVIILHKCTKNYDHMVYCSWDMVRDRCNCYSSFWAIFCPFTPLTAQKIKISKKKKQAPGNIIILHKCTRKYD